MITLNQTVMSLDPYLLLAENNVPVSIRQIFLVLNLAKLWIFL